MTSAIKNSNRLDWEFETNLPVKDYEKKLEEYARRGLRPRCVTSLGPASNPLYTAIWIEADKPPAR